MTAAGLAAATAGMVTSLLAPKTKTWLKFPGAAVPVPLLPMT